MSKNKKDKKKNKKNIDQKSTSLLTNVKSMVKKKPVLISLIGAGLGIAFASMGKGNRKAITDKVASTFKGFAGTSGQGTGNGRNQGNNSSNGHS